MIKNLIFDFGKVLVDYDFESFFRKHIPDAKRCLAFAPVLYNEDVQQLLDREERPFDVIMEEIIAQHKEFEPEIRHFNEHYPEIVTNEVEGMYDLLTQLKAEGYKLYGLTNWCSKVHLTMSQFPIFKLLDGQIISSEEKVIKPEPEIYQRLFTRFGLKPEECIFTDDRPENIEGGRRVGMEGIVFTDARQYEKALRQHLAAAAAQDAAAHPSQREDTDTRRHRCHWATPTNPLYLAYHDEEWGEPCHDDRQLFEMLILEGFQAGLSWECVLNKREAFREAFDNFDVQKVVKYNDNKLAELAANPKIIRNRLKLRASVTNAKAFIQIQQEFGSFDNYIWGFTDRKVILEPGDLRTTSPLSDTISRDLKRRGMKFVGSTIVYSYLQAIGIINGHLEGCFKYKPTGR